MDFLHQTPKVATWVIYYYFIETALMGSASFSKAVNYGAEEFYEDQPHIDAGEENYGWIDILEAHNKGILPMSWKQAFEKELNQRNPLEGINLFHVETYEGSRFSKATTNF